MDAQVDVLQQRLQSVGVELFGPDGGRDFSRWFPDHDKLFGHAQTAVGTASSILANTLVIVFLGLLFALRSASLPRWRRVAGQALVARPCAGRSGRDGWRLALVARRTVYQDRADDRVRLACSLSIGASGCFSARFAGRRIKFRALSRPNTGGHPGRIGSHASGSLDADLGSRDLYRHTVD